MDVNGKSILRNQSGAALVIALIMMVVLTLIGLASSYTSIFEIKLSGNKRGATDAFYTADGGVQSVKVNLTNFTAPDGYTAVNPDILPVDLRNESINQRRTNPTFSLPEGVNFSVQPQVVVYHTTTESAPRGLGMSATGNIEYSYYIIDSIGRDQIDSSIIPANCQVREKVVRFIPTSQGGN
jgi:type IV pilus assembly protein PilX